MWVWVWLWIPTEVRRRHQIWSWSYSGCELPDVGVGSLTLVLWQSSNSLNTEPSLQPVIGVLVVVHFVWDKSSLHCCLFVTYLDTLRSETIWLM